MDDDMEGIKASLENDVLVVNVPKVEKKGDAVKVIGIEFGGGNPKNDKL
jgi:HSP20 family molecular chaperone IbpA